MVAKVLIYRTEGTEFLPCKENHSSCGAIYPPQMQPSHSTQNDATAHTLTPKMVLSVRLFTESPPPHTPLPVSIISQ
ncbi:hypothetical protein TNCV_4043301 [Trichonephila clavipes]|nr:hypothetical protein TNCV_4043301 [Trichonephila clavipes]